MQWGHLGQLLWVESHMQWEHMDQLLSRKFNGVRLYWLAIVSRKSNAVRIYVTYWGIPIPHWGEHHRTHYISVCLISRRWLKPSCVAPYVNRLHLLLRHTTHAVVLWWIPCPLGCTTSPSVCYTLFHALWHRQLPPATVVSLCWPLQVFDVLHLAPAPATRHVTNGISCT